MRANASPRKFVRHFLLLAFVQCEPISIGVGHEGRKASGKVHHIRDCDAFAHKRRVHPRYVIDFERRAKLRAGFEPDRFRISDNAERASADIEFNPRVSERIGRREADRVPVKRHCALDISDGINHER